MYIFVGIFLISAENVRPFPNGSTVAPSANEHLVFMRESVLSEYPTDSFQCTATTQSGQQLRLAPPSETVKAFYGARWSAAKLYAVAELPTDQGALTINCSAAWLSASGSAHPI